MLVVVVVTNQKCLWELKVVQMSCEALTLYLLIC